MVSMTPPAAAGTSSPGDAQQPPPLVNLNDYKDLEELHAALNDLANRCKDKTKGVQEDVIGCAALAETMVDSVVQQQHSQEEGSSSNNSLTPTVVTYNAVLKAWASAAAALADNRGRGSIQTNMGTDMLSLNVYTARDAAQRANTILDQLEHDYKTGKSNLSPDCVSYNIVIDAWGKCGVEEEAIQADNLMKRMVELSVKGCAQDVEATRTDPADWKQVAPDAITYNAVIDAWTHNLQNEEGLKRAETIYNHMKTQYAKNPNGSVKPGLRTMNAVCQAYAKSNFKQPDKYLRWDAAQKAEAILREGAKQYAETGDEDFKPDVVTYTNVIDAFGRVRDLKATQKVESLLLEMQRQYEGTKDSRIRPNFRTYTAVITAWSRTIHSTSALRAEELLFQMEEQHAQLVASGEEVTFRIKPNYRTYTAVITAWARSRDPTKPQRAVRLLKRMNDMYKAGDETVRPNSHAFNSVIEACATLRGTFEQQGGALKVAFAVYKSIQSMKGEDATNVTYSTLLKATEQLMTAGDERNQIATVVFEKAKKEGMVDGEVLKHLRRAVDSTLYLELCAVAAQKNGYVDFEKIPQAWATNVQTKSRYY